MVTLQMFFISMLSLALITVSLTDKEEVNQ